MAKNCLNTKRGYWNGDPRAMDRMKKLKEREHLRISKKIHYNWRNSDWVAQMPRKNKKPNDSLMLRKLYQNMQI